MVLSHKKRTPKHNLYSGIHKRNATIKFTPVAQFPSFQTKFQSHVDNQDQAEKSYHDA